MAETTPSPASPTQLSITGALGSLLDNILPAARDVLVAKYQNDGINPNAGSGAGQNKPGQTGDWRDTVSTGSPTSVTKQAWFWPAVVGVGALMLGVLAFALFGGRRRD